MLTFDAGWNSVPKSVASVFNGILGPRVDRSVVHHRPPFPRADYLSFIAGVFRRTCIMHMPATLRIIETTPRG